MIKLILLALILIIVVNTLLIATAKGSSITKQLQGYIDKTFGSMLNKDVDNLKENNDKADTAFIYGTNQEETAKSITVDNKGNVYICVHRTDFENESSNLVIKISSTGTKLGSPFKLDTLGNISYVSANSIFFFKDALYVAGYGKKNDLERMVVTKIDPYTMQPTGFKQSIIGGYDPSDRLVANALFVNSQGIFVAGFLGTSLHVAKLDHNTGKVITSYSLPSSSHSSLIYAEGAYDIVGDSTYVYVVGDKYSDSTQQDVVVVKLKQQDLSLDTSFNYQGYVTLDSIVGGSNHDRGRSIAIDGKRQRLYVCGFSSKVFVVCLDTVTGDNVVQFGNAGFVQLFVNYSSSRAFSVDVDLQGKVYVGGDFLTDHGYRAFVCRLNPDGTKDTSFANGGYIVFHGIAGGISDTIQSIFVDNRFGRFVTGGSVSKNNDSDAFVIKLI
ncbi:MAG: hypothetical protein ABDH21_02330 [bacterium]